MIVIPIDMHTYIHISVYKYVYVKELVSTDVSWARKSSQVELKVHSHGDSLSWGDFQIWKAGS